MNARIMIDTVKGMRLFMIGVIRANADPRANIRNNDVIRSVGTLPWRAIMKTWPASPPQKNSVRISVA